MDELIQHCVRELSYDGDFGELHALLGVNFPFASLGRGSNLALRLHFMLFPCTHMPLHWYREQFYAAAGVHQPLLRSPLIIEPEG